jgi:hypothetical protein
MAVLATAVFPIVPIILSVGHLHQLFSRLDAGNRLGSRGHWALVVVGSVVLIVAVTMLLLPRSDGVP